MFNWLFYCSHFWAKVTFLFRSSFWENLSTFSGDSSHDFKDLNDSLEFYKLQTNNGVSGYEFSPEGLLDGIYKFLVIMVLGGFLLKML